jgi:hypothetical protein
MLRCTNRFALALPPLTKRQTRRLAKFADQLSGTRHFKVPLYPIEDHLAQRVSMTRSDQGMVGKTPGAALPRLRIGRSARERLESGERIRRVRRYHASLVAWLTQDGRYRIGSVLANDR